MEREDDALRRWRDLLAMAVREVEAGTPVPVMNPAAEALTAGRMDTEAGDNAPSRALGVIKNLGGTAGTAVSTLLNQAAPSSGAANWLKWLNPIAGLLGLFTGKGDGEGQLEAPVMSPRPAKRSLEYALTASEGGGFRAADMDEWGRVRVRDEQQAGPSQVVVQVKAMDSQSFLDHRDEIASAVKQALMESHGLGTVLGEFRG